MAAISNPKVLYLKGALFLLLGTVAALLIVLESPTLRTAALLGVTVWSFCRAYYFAFYVVQHYVDPGYRFAGLLDFARYAMRRHGARDPDGGK